MLYVRVHARAPPRLNESPYEKVGKFPTPPTWTANQAAGLNESPYEKVGKSTRGLIRWNPSIASMKVPTKK